MSKKKSGAILVLAAVEEELAELAKSLDRPRREWIAGRSLVKGHLQGRETWLLNGGPGMVNAALALGGVIAGTSIADWPILVIQTGIAGAFPGTGLTLGDVAVATTETDASLGLEPADGGPVPDPLPFPVVTYPPGAPPPPDATVRGKRPGSFLLNKIVRGKAMKALNASFPDHPPVEGPFLTVSTVTTTAARAKALETAFSPVMESMEGAAAAQVTAAFGLPFLEIRAVSNMVGPRDRSFWDIPLAARNVQAAVSAVIAAW